MRICSRTIPSGFAFATKLTIILARTRPSLISHECSPIRGPGLLTTFALEFAIVIIKQVICERLELIGNDFFGHSNIRKSRQSGNTFLIEMNKSHPIIE